MKKLGATGDQYTVGASNTFATAQQPATLDVGELFEEHAPFVSRVITRLLGDGPHVDDLVQETFLVAHRKRSSFGWRSQPRTWLYGIAARLCMRHQRSEKRFRLFSKRLVEEPTEKHSAPPSANIEREQKREIVLEVLGKLPFKQREVFVLYELEELDGATISQMLGIAEGTVWTRLHHGRKRFRELMEKRIKRDEP